MKESMPHLYYYVSTNWSQNWRNWYTKGLNKIPFAAEYPVDTRRRFNVYKTSIQRRRFTKFLRTLILKNICKRLLLNFHHGLSVKYMFKTYIPTVWFCSFSQYIVSFFRDYESIPYEVRITRLKILHWFSLLKFLSGSGYKW